MRIAFAGNPNSGKTTMYNALTGRNEKVGNWAGVTVDKKEAPIRRSYAEGQELIAVDLPGAYSMSPFTSEESITSAYVKNEHPDAIINIVDATNLSRSLFFTTQLLELGIPVVVALNKHDINEKKETRIDVKALSEKLGCPVVDTTSTTGEGLQELVRAAAALKGKGQKAPYNQGDVDLTDKAAVAAADRKRFAFVNKTVVSVETRKVLTKNKNYQDSIDAVLTHPVAGLAYLMFNLFTPPCFAALGAMNSEIKSRKWFWGGIGLQFATGYTIAYLVYTVGTLITAPASLNVGAAIIGLAVVVAIALVIAGMIRNTNKKLASEYALSGK